MTDENHRTEGNGLNWQVGSYYRLRNGRLVGRIIAIENGRLKGQIFTLDKLRRESEQLLTDPKDAEGTTEWDFGGNSYGVATQDLMEVLR